MMNINNFPSYAEKKNYIVVRYVDNEFWFWGAYDNPESAYRAAQAVDGTTVISNR